MLNDDGFQDLEALEHKISLVTLEDAMLVTEQNEENAQEPEVLDSARYSAAPE